MAIPWATALYAALSALLVLALAGLVVAARRDLKVGLGSGGHELLERRIRVHANAVENLPLALVLLLVLELTGPTPWLVHALGIALIAGRLMHAQGLGGRSGYSFGRFWGMALCWGAMAAAALVLLWRGVAALLA